MFRSKESVPVEVQSTTPSRRALLAGVLGGAGAWMATALGRATQVRAGVDGDVVLGGDNVSPETTSITKNGAGDVFATHSDTGDCINGYAGSSTAVYGTSLSGTGTFGGSTSGIGLYGFTSTSAKPASYGQSAGNGTGVLGHSNNGVAPIPPAAKPKTGVFGYAAQDTSARGVWGESPAGIGLYGRTTTGFAGYFQGKVFMSSFQEMIEVATPAAPGANRARLFVRDNGAGKTQLCVRFPTGSVKLLAQET